MNISDCPFCGGQAYLFESHGEYAVACTECGVRTHNGGEQEVIGQWNRRCPEPVDGTDATLSEISKRLESMDKTMHRISVNITSLKHKIKKE